ncbi:MAG: carbon starvation protein A [Rhodospirillaceae bacterium]|nr:carbon starvation protein A [Rhodospirillaceae bacterium]
MELFFFCVAALIAGYFIYGTFVDRVFGPNPARAVPSQALRDGVDYEPMGNKRVYLIQLLNIAGLGPIFGPILGALYGPDALIWIVIGCIFGGGVHDYFSGMLSVRANGASVPNVVGQHLGNGFKQFMNVFAIILLLLVGVVFVLGPARLLGSMTGMAAMAWVGIIFAYYFLATILPVNKIIGRLYPVFGALLAFMSIGLTVAFCFSDQFDFYPVMTLENTHPTDLPMWPLMFITIACGAISGFHATQSPLMARCIRNERAGKQIFYGAMIGEGVIALVWATLGLSFYQNADALNAALAEGGPGYVVHEVSTTLLGGGIGGILAILGVVILPITSGDTAFRSARLIIAEYVKLPQQLVVKRLLVAVPLFAVGIAVSQADFAVIWRYFGWANQTLAAVMLWAAAAYLLRERKLHWIATIPAAFMTAVTVSFLAYAEIGFGLSIDIATAIGIGGAVVALVAFFSLVRPKAGVSLGKAAKA